ncbi:MAG: ATP-binding protein [Acidobacteriota bacterium]
MGEHRRADSINDGHASEESLIARPRSRRYRLILLTILTFTLLALSVSLGTFKPLIPVPNRPSDTLLLYALSSLNFIASLVLLAVLTRNLLKLYRERAEQRLGSKFKTKMVIFSIGISLLPGILLFFFAYGLLNSSLDTWFSSPANSFFNSAQYIQREFLNREIEDLTKTTRTLRRLAGLSGRVARTSEPPVLTQEDQRLLLREYNNQQLLFLEITSETGIIFSSGAEKVEMLTELAEARADVTAGRAYSHSIRGPDQRTIYLVVGLPIFQAAKPVGGIYSVRQLPQNLADRLQEIAKHAEDRDALSRNSRRIKITNLYLLGAMTLLLIFAATWIALYVARGITVPIQALAEATQAVARGDFDTRVRCPGEDELAILIQSFNQMASQLSANRYTLELAAEQLRETNRALEERRRYIETILHSLSTGIISLDSDHCLTTINQAALTMLRREDIPPASTPVDQLFPSDNQAEILRLVRRARRIGQLTREMQIHGQPSPLHTAVTITPLRDNDSTFCGSVMMIEDISELIRAQRSAVWSEVARRMAHEIKNPLTPIQLSAERIAKNTKRLGSTLETKFNLMVEECTATIKQEVGTLQRMVEEFSRFARLPQTQPGLASLNEVVVETLKLYDERLENLQIDTRLSEDLPLLNIDKEQIKRALVNLIDNAVEAMNGSPSERRLSVSTEYLRDRELAKLTVSDSGHGIAPGDREKLFQPYFSTRKRGTGLGLAIVSHIVTDHNGKIRFEDNQPCGTRFIVELPISESSSSFETPTQAPAKNGAVSKNGDSLLNKRELENVNNPSRA